ncbi:zinc finger A20 and AN1 domain-containing stress-associated protein 2-like [Cynara cardunculus var. scolymus]|uniref:zinc finger A20 and AN1 domain-containing stress-associated protein 2-like n=1 Tax=Cynara cardunculus var. scolymus TaxID=59895 RepID=UPI000D626BD0|nr:zinc finger A20 and AN1 domain-containing stress-associated protein 2-like [Cynara cardunculus var. scolymus]
MDMAAPSTTAQQEEEVVAVNVVDPSLLHISVAIPLEEVTVAAPPLHPNHKKDKGVKFVVAKSAIRQTMIDMLDYRSKLLMKGTHISVHRYSDKHDCPFDYRTTAKDAIAKANPVVKAEKLEKI